MNAPPDSPGTPPSPASHSGETDHRPDSASLIHAVATRLDRSGALKDSEARQRELVERTNQGLLLHSLHEIADAIIPPAQRRLVQEAEVRRALAVLRRFALLFPAVGLEQLLLHCETAAAADRNPVAHLIDPLQLRHLLTFREERADAFPPPEEFPALERLVAHAPAAEITAWFGRLEESWPQLSKSTPGALRDVFARSCRAFAPEENLATVACETAVLTLRLQGIVGLEDTRLFFSLHKQIAGPALPGMDDYLQSDEINHATTQHRTAGHASTADYFRGLAQTFDHGRLPALEQHLSATAAARSAPGVPEPPAAPEPPPPAAPAEPRRGLFSGLRTFLSRS